MIRKLIGGIVFGIVLFVVSKVLGFPTIFQYMFFGYAMLGMLVFMLLDAPAMKPITGIKAVVSLVAFYLILSVFYIGGASILPQYDPEDEKGKIDKLLAAKRRQSELGKTEDLIARAKALDEKAKALQDRLKNLGKDVIQEGLPAPEADGAKPVAAVATGANLEALGFEQWQLQECYNCHKLNGEGGKKRGPELDNIGSYMTAAELKLKIEDPKTFMAEGFEKEWEKKKMPDKYKELMEEKDIEVLAAWLATMKNTSVNTPKPIKK